MFQRFSCFSRVEGRRARWSELGLSWDGIISYKEDQNRNQSSFLCSCREMKVKTNRVFFLFTLTCKMYLIIPNWYVLITVMLSHIDSSLEFTKIRGACVA